jgi:hypothetical protein
MGQNEKREQGRLMHTETNERMERIRSDVRAGQAALSDLKTQLAANTDKYVNQILQLASNWFDDVETLFLGMLKQEQTPPRTLAEESRVLGSAEYFLHRMAIPQLKAIQKMVAKFGPSVRSIG